MLSYRAKLSLILSYRHQSRRGSLLMMLPPYYNLDHHFLAIQSNAFTTFQFWTTGAHVLQPFNNDKEKPCSFVYIVHFKRCNLNEVSHQ